VLEPERRVLGVHEDARGDEQVPTMIVRLVQVPAPLVKRRRPRKELALTLTGREHPHPSELGEMRGESSQFGEIFVRHESWEARFGVSVDARGGQEVSFLETRSRRPKSAGEAERGAGILAEMGKPEARTSFAHAEGRPAHDRTRRRHARA
jgi:hypothetical protein